MNWHILRGRDEHDTYPHRRDTAAVPANPAQLPYVDLYMETPSGGSLFVSRVATNVDVKGGSVNIVVPEARPGKYFFMGKSFLSLSSVSHMDLIACACSRCLWSQ